MAQVEIPPLGAITLRIRWERSRVTHTWRLVVDEYDDDFGWVMVCPLSEFPQNNPHLVDFLPNAREEELPPWA